MEIWVQPSRSLLDRWCGRRCAPWREYHVVWAQTWAEIPAAVQAVESCGLYHRMLICAEEYEHDREQDAWVPADQL